MDYLVVIERGEDGSFSAYVPDLPGCVSSAATVESVRSEIAETIHLHIESLRRHNEPVPSPSAIGRVVSLSI